MRVRYGLTSIEPYERAGEWRVRATINPTVDNSLGVPSGAGGSPPDGQRAGRAAFTDQQISQAKLLAVQMVREDRDIRDAYEHHFRTHSELLAGATGDTCSDIRHKFARARSRGKHRDHGLRARSHSAEYGEGQRGTVVIAGEEHVVPREMSFA